jgi:DNA-binding winged helix-turn-helix (wHTH) protein
MNDSKTTIFVFPPFRLDPGRRTLTRDGRLIALKPKEFDALLVLLEEDGRVVDKDDLMARVWPDSYVGEGSLAKNISVLRKALGEKVIETHRGRGYRVTVPIVTTSSAAYAQSALPSDEQFRTATQPPETEDISSTGGRRRPWWARRAAVASAMAAVLLLAFPVYHFVVIKIAAHHSSESTVHSILIQKEGGLDPLDEGFQLARPDGSYKHVIPNSKNNGFDRWRLVTDDQNVYYRRLSDEEKKFALQHDWKLTCVCAVEKGGGSCNIDLGPGIGPRFDIGFDQDGKKYFIDLTKQISPEYEFERVEFPGLADVEHPHIYELRFDHLSQTASLWIDGQQKASGYRGHHQYQENKGLMFGAATYLDAKEASMVFREVRFEVK